MCNCNNDGRAQRVKAPPPTTTRGPIVTRETQPDGPSVPARRFVEMIYVGATGMTAVGPVTATRYRFGGSGARVRIDARDAVALAQIPRLRAT